MSSQIAIKLAPPQRGTARLADRRMLTDKFLFLSFEMSQPANLDFQAGQYVSIKVAESGARRAYSICSSPAKTHGFDLMIDISPMGVGVQFLYALKLGFEVDVLGPMGRFVVAPTESAPTGTPLVFVATGSGLAPLRSMILDQLQLRHNQAPMILYWGLRRIENLAWQDDFLQLTQAFSNFAFHPTLSQGPDVWTLCRGRVTDCLQVHELLPNAHYYLCGGNAMIQDVVPLLQHRGVSEANIHFEKYF